jgi:hypothetical protein
MSDIFGAVGQVAGAAITAAAMKDAAETQARALEKQRQFVFSQLDPAKINMMAGAADVDQVRNRLALQGAIDPSLLKARFESQDAILNASRGLGADSTAMKTGELAAKEAVAGVKGMDQVKASLIGAALKEISAGATLPPDVQAELVQTGLEKSGMVTGKAGAQGVGGQLIRQLIGTAGINLQGERQKRATALAGAAQELEASRQSILQNIFPNLSAVQLNQLTGQQNVLNQSNSMVPQVGLSGSDIANLWMARVGATNQLAQAGADARAAGGMAAAQAWQPAIGAAIRGAGSLMPTARQAWGSVFGPSTTSGYGGDTAADFLAMGGF